MFFETRFRHATATGMPIPSRAFSSAVYSAVMTVELELKFKESRAIVRLIRDVFEHGDEHFLVVA